MEGDLVRVIQEELIREVRLQDFLPHIEHRPPVIVGILPKSAIFLRWDEEDPRNKRVSVMSELVPAVRTCRYGTRQFQLSVPWTYFLYDFVTKGDPMEGMGWSNVGARVFWAREQVTSLDSELRTALVPNCSQDGNICYGNTGVDARMSLGVRIDRQTDEFYRTTFMHDSGAGSPWGSETGLVNWKRWEEETKKNPAAFLDFPEWEGSKKPAPRGRTHMDKYTARQLLGSHFDRAKPIEAEGLIPPMVQPMTFMRAEEWLASISPFERHQLFVGLTNMQAENPGTIAAPPTTGPGAIEDIGGMEIANV